MTADLLIEKVGKRFGRHRALSNVSAVFKPGQVGVILGPNGAGKSTLMGIIATLVRASSGLVRWGEHAMKPGVPARARIGYVGHDPGLYGDLSAQQNLALFARLHGVGADDGGSSGKGIEARIASLLERVGLQHVLADRAEAPVKTFSRGMQQRLALARALLHEPALLLFDEPASALDPAGAAWLGEQLARQRAAGRIVVMVTHDLDAAAGVTDHALILRRGRVACDRSFDKPPAPAELRDLYREQTHARA